MDFALTYTAAIKTNGSYSLLYCNNGSTIYLVNNLCVSVNNGNWTAIGDSRLAMFQEKDDVTELAVYQKNSVNNLTVFSITHDDKTDIELTERSNYVNNLLTLTIDSNGLQTNYVYNDSGRLTSYACADGENVSYGYTCTDYAETVTCTSSFTGESGSTSTSETRDVNGNVLSYTDAMGNVYNRTVNENNQLTLFQRGSNTNSLTYNGTKPTALTHDGCAFGFAYNKENVASVSANGWELFHKTYGFDTETKGKTETLKYANTPSSYVKKCDTLGRTVEISFGDSVLEQFFYHETDTNPSAFSDNKRSSKLRKRIDFLGNLVYYYVYKSVGNKETPQLDCVNVKVRNTDALLFTDKVQKTKNSTTGFVTSTRTYDNSTVDSIASAYSQSGTLLSDTASFGSTSFATAYTYDTSKRLATQTRLLSSNGMTKTFAYAKGRLSSETTKRKTPSGETNLSSANYTYNANGSITQVSNGTQNIRYSYDSCNRLVREDNPVSGKTTTYTYNAGGNVSRVYETSYTLASTLPFAIGDIEAAYAYDSDNNDVLLSITYSEFVEDNSRPPIMHMSLRSVPLPDGVWQTNYVENFTYGYTGNPTVYRGGTLTWARSNLLSSASGFSYTYNADGIRTSKTNSTTSTSFQLDGSRIVTETRTANDTTTTLRFFYDSTGLSGLSVNDIPYVYVRNALGDVTEILDANNNVVAQYRYNAWGKAIYASDALANVNPFRYRGKYFAVLMLTVLCKIDLHEVKETMTARQVSTTCKPASTILPNFLTVLTKYLRRSAKRE